MTCFHMEKPGEEPAGDGGWVLPRFLRCSRLSPDSFLRIL